MDRLAPARNTLVVLTVLVACACLAGPARAATYSVNSVVDRADATAGDGACDADAQTAGNQCTLRAAMAQTDATTVVVPAGDYALSLGVIAITGNLDLVGAGARGTVIRQTRPDRVLSVGSRAVVNVSGVTVAGGTADGQERSGGNVYNLDGTVSITDSTISGGRAVEGAGVSNELGEVTVQRSTLTGNVADVDGGAILNAGNADQEATLTVDNSTISGNGAGLGGGIVSRIHSKTFVTIKNSTITSNSSGARGGGGGLLVEDGTASVENTIVAQNSSAGSPLTPNCSKALVGASIGSLGFNLESGTDCGFTAAGDLRGADPRLGPLQNVGGPTDTRPLLTGSPAIDAGVTLKCPPTDQRGVSRPQGTACDVGAYEATLDTVIVSGPPPSTRDRTPTFTFSSPRPGATFECSLDGGPFLPCASPFTAPTLGAGRHTFAVRSRDAFGNVDPTPAVLTFVIPAELRDLPAPVLGKSFNAEPVSGSVLVAVPRGAGAARGVVARAAQKGLTFVPLREAKQIPIGSFFNARKGTVRLQSATTRRGRRQAGTFSGGLFQTLQSGKRSANGVFELRLKGSSFRSCATRGRRAGSAAGGERSSSGGRRPSAAGERASASARSRRTIRRLRGNAKGRFRTRGRYSAATVRGTVWTVTDRCDGTLTQVSRGKVAVRDFPRGKSVLVRRGKSYLARARG